MDAVLLPIQDDITRLDDKFLFAVLLIALYHFDESAYKMLTGATNVTLGGKRQRVNLSDWITIAGDSAVCLKQAIADYRHWINYAAYKEALGVHIKIAKTASAPARKRIEALLEIIRVWNQYNFGDNVAKRTEDKAARKLMSEDEATKLLQEVLEAYAEELARVARNGSRDAFLDLFWLRVAVRRTGEEPAVRRTGEKPADRRKVLSEFRSDVTVTWTEVDGWLELVDRYIPQPTLADLGLEEDQIPEREFEVMVSKALASRNRLDAKTVAAHLLAHTGSTDPVRRAKIMRLAHRRSTT